MLSRSRARQSWPWDKSFGFDVFFSSPVIIIHFTPSTFYGLSVSEYRDPNILHKHEINHLYISSAIARIVYALNARVRVGVCSLYLAAEQRVVFRLKSYFQKEKAITHISPAVPEDKLYFYLSLSPPASCVVCRP